METIEPKLFYAVTTGEKEGFAKIVIVKEDGDPGAAYYPSRAQLLNLLVQLVTLLRYAV